MRAFHPRPTSCIAATLLLAALLSTAACTDSGDEPSAPEPGPESATAARTLPSTTSHQAGVELPGGLTTTGLGERCVDCHEDVVESFRSSAMHDALTLPEGEGSIEAGLVGRVIVHPQTGLTARFDVRDGKYLQTLFYVDPTGVERTSFTAPVDFVIGSGHATRSYLQLREGRLLEMPLTWYRELNGLAISPGPGFWERTLRHADNMCIACHTGDVTPIRADASVGFSGHISLGVTCERCHGPSDDHVESGDPRTTVNPARLEPGRQEQACQQCHLSDGVTIEATDRTIATYVPGQDLGEWLSIFRPERKQVTDRAEIAGHGSRMRLSKCFTATDGSDNPLTCTTCHNPHRGFKRDETTRETDRGCLVCHERDACHSPTGAAGTQPCFTCHMAVAPAADIAHTKVTDHWIRRVPPPPSESAKHLPHAGDLALAGGRLIDTLAPGGTTPAQMLRAARAYARGAEMARIVHGREAEAWRDLAFALSGAYLREFPDDPYALRVRGRILTFKGETAAARRVLERASALLPDLPGPTAELAYACAEEYDFETAEPLLARVQQLDPFDEDVAVARARVLVELGRREEAVRVLEEIRARLGPSVSRGQLAVDIATGGGNLEAALRHVYDVIMFLPRQPDVHTKAGDILIAMGENERARVHLNEALRLAPGFRPARELLSRLEQR